MIEMLPQQASAVADTVMQLSACSWHIRDSVADTQLHVSAANTLAS